MSKKPNYKNVQRSRLMMSISESERRRAELEEQRARIRAIVKSAPVIKTSELETAIYDLEGIFQETDSDRYEAMRKGLIEIYEPRKQYRVLPVDQLNKPMLELLGGEEDDDPESVKILRAKSIAIRDMLKEKAELKAKKERLYKNYL